MRRSRTASMYIGTDNVAAGRQAGELMKKALPNGGKVMLFVGTMDAANARERTQGIKEAIAGTKIEIVDIRTDGGDQAKAKANVEDTLTKYPDIDLLVGLWAYNTPQIYNAVKAAGKAGQVKIVGFDEDQQTLKGIADGVIDGTVVQQPYEFGYQSMIKLAKYIEGDKSVVPAEQARHHPDRDHRQVERGRLRRRRSRTLLAEVELSRAAVLPRGRAVPDVPRPSGRSRAPTMALARGMMPETLLELRFDFARPIPVSPRSTASASRCSRGEVLGPDRRERRRQIDADEDPRRRRRRRPPGRSLIDGVERARR